MNTPPIFGNYPGWISGSKSSGIAVTLVYDLLCEDSMANNVVMNELWTMPFNGSTVGQEIELGITLMPLPYHIHAFSVNQMIPYFLDQCAADASTCGQLNQYKDYCFTPSV